MSNRDRHEIKMRKSEEEEARRRRQEIHSCVSFTILVLSFLLFPPFNFLSFRLSIYFLFPFISYFPFPSFISCCFLSFPCVLFLYSLLSSFFPLSFPFYLFPSFKFPSFPFVFSLNFSVAFPFLSSPPYLPLPPSVSSH